jgi:hypothetical protein
VDTLPEGAAAGGIIPPSPRLASPRAVRRVAKRVGCSGAFSLERDATSAGAGGGMVW